MRLMWPDFDSQATGGLLVCRGNLKPLDICREYSVRVEYRMGNSPSIWIDGLPAPDDEPSGNKIPHRYRDGSICLFCGSEWTADKAIAQTILPWLLEWLVFYEGWLCTGKWQGGGTRREARAQRQQDSAARPDDGG